MILDDGGDATLLIHLGMKAEKDLAVVGNPTNDEEEALFAAIKKRVAAKPGWYTQLGKAILGVTEETTTGVHRLYEMQKAGTQQFRSEEHKSELPSLMCRSYAVFGLKKKKRK